MVQAIVRNGETHNFPDDASLEEINNALSNDNESSISTFIGRLPNKSSHKILQEMNNPNTINEMISWGIGAPGMKAVEEGVPLVKTGIKKSIDYLRPEKKAEEFRTYLGEGTSKENIAKIGENVKSSYEEQLKKALEPKEELFSKYRETPILENPKHSEYLSDEDVSKYYQRKGDLIKKHEAYENQPIVKNYDALQSALKKEVRQIESRPFIGDAAEAKLNQLKLNIKNLDEDVSKWSKNLPKEDQNLEKGWRKLYRENVAPYENAPESLKKLAEGRWEEVKPSDIGSIFTNMTKETQKIFNDLPPQTSKMILYNAIQKVPPGDAEGLANTIIDLKRTKGYDKFIDENIINWANKMKKQVGRSKLIKEALLSVGGGTIGDIMFGPMGGAIGAIAPFAKDTLVHLVKRIKK